MPESEPPGPDSASTSRGRLWPGGPLDDTASDRRLVAACLRGNEQAWAALAVRRFAEAETYARESLDAGLGRAELADGRPWDRINRYSGRKC